MIFASLQDDSMNGTMPVITVRVRRFVGVSAALSSVLDFGCF